MKNDRLKIVRFSKSFFVWIISFVLMSCTSILMSQQPVTIDNPESDSYKGINDKRLANPSDMVPAQQSVILKKGREENIWMAEYHNAENQIRQTGGQYISKSDFIEIVNFVAAPSYFQQNANLVLISDKADCSSDFNSYSCGHKVKGRFHNCKTIIFSPPSCISEIEFGGRRMKLTLGIQNL